MWVSLIMLFAFYFFLPQCLTIFHLAIVSVFCVPAYIHQLWRTLVVKRNPVPKIHSLTFREIYFSYIFQINICRYTKCHVYQVIQKHTQGGALGRKKIITRCCHWVVFTRIIFLSHWLLQGVTSILIVGQEFLLCQFFSLSASMIPGGRKKLVGGGEQDTER